MVKPWGQLALRYDHTKLGNTQVVPGKCWEKVWVSSMHKADSQEGLGEKKGQLQQKTRTQGYD